MGPLKVKEACQLGNSQNQPDFSRDKNNINTFATFKDARWMAEIVTYAIF
jgi:hypothetical protein